MAKGETIHIPISVVNRDPKIWGPDAAEFRFVARTAAYASSAEHTQAGALGEGAGSGPERPWCMEQLDDLYRRAARLHWISILTR